MTAVYKFVMEGPVSRFQVSALHKVLSCGMQKGSIVVWIVVDPDARQDVWVEIEAVNTGPSLDCDLTKRQFVGTVTSGNGIVWHIFARQEDPFT